MLKKLSILTFKPFYFYFMLCAFDAFSFDACVPAFYACAFFSYLHMLAAAEKAAEQAFSSFA
jgi:hypothetical protein